MGINRVHIQKSALWGTRPEATPTGDEGCQSASFPGRLMFPQSPEQLDLRWVLETGWRNSMDSHETNKRPLCSTNCSPVPQNFEPWKETPFLHDQLEGPGMQLLCRRDSVEVLCQRCKSSTNAASLLRLSLLFIFSCCSRWHLLPDHQGPRFMP